MAVTSASTGPSFVSRPVRIDIADDSCRVAHHDCLRGNVLGDDGAGADHSCLTNGEARKDRRVGADRSVVTDERSWEAYWPLPTAGKWIVGERGVRPDEHVIAESHAVPQLHPALDRHPVPDHNVILDEGLVTDVAVPAYDGAGQNVCERPNTGART